MVAVFPAIPTFSPILSFEGCRQATHWLFGPLCRYRRWLTEFRVLKGRIEKRREEKRREEKEATSEFFEAGFFRRLFPP